MPIELSEPFFKAGRNAPDQAASASGGGSPPSPAVRALALAHHLRRRIDRGEFAGQSELARHLGFTRARVSQILDLTLLAPNIQEDLLCQKNSLHVTETDLRWVVGSIVWTEQRQRWREVQQLNLAAEPIKLAFKVSSRR
jgi:hypothetical protein